MPQELTDIEIEMLRALKLLGGYSLSDMQELADEAFRDLMKEPRRSTTAKQSPCGQQLFGGLAPSIGRDHGRLP